MRLFLFAPLLFAVTSLAAAAQSTATLTIDTDKPIAKVSPTLYGMMTEEINYSYDGGLYAELVQQPHLPDEPRRQPRTLDARAERRLTRQH